ncbi:BlaI/MecI/CopY family transcriptional regulator [Umezawaea tangerina]|uniref:BlaI/MecI/CopY family transcriptional regulator n=1 Tax=Umezawaea tangerina TaxID=84725 RepID=UPI001FE885B4|nr:BlaI/MecI/CopY family transcriptional regulator [Umezawaea tangerina]
MEDDVREQTDRRAPGELEAAVLTALWAATGPRTPAEVQQDLGDALAYSTVATILSRLHTKGVVGRVKRGRSYVYAPVADEPGVAARRMHQVLDARADRDTVLARFVSDLSPADELLLRGLLEEG